MSNATQNSQSTPVSKAARSFSRFVRTSVKPVVFKLSRKLSVTYWPGRRRTISAMLLALLSGFVPGLAGAAPTGGQVVAGSATVLKPTSTTTQVNQTSQNVILNWQNFSIGAGETVRFVQPSASAVALNRVTGSDASRIFGTLTANGHVFLVNSAGVYFAPGASVDVGGLVASSLSISNASFMSGKYQFEAGAQSGAVANYGQLRGAFVVLAAPQVTNAGSIVTTGGATALAAGGRVSLDIAGDQLVSMSVDAATANAAVLNSGSISADGGKVFMSASSANAVLDTVINTTGIVRAGSIALRNGQIVIDGGSAGVVSVGGTLAASGAGAGTHGGSVKVLGDKVALLAGASIDVSGDAGGGSALVGGDLHGAGGVRTAAMTRVEQGAVINADALTSGNGGKVVVWSDQHTAFGGAISAKGGAQGGDGGFVETSGKKTLAFAGKVSTTAARGATGTLLLDPTDITISNDPSSLGMAEAGGTFSDNSAGSSTLNVGDLTLVLGGSNVIVDTASGQSGTGNIVVSDPVAYTSANSLTLKADANITVNQPITNNGSGAINLNGGGVISSGTLTSTGGDINIAGNAGGSSRAGSVTGTSITSNGGNVNVRSSGAVTTGAVNAGSGTISIDGASSVEITGALTTSNAGASAIVVKAGANSSAGSAGGGDITFSGGSVTVGAGGYAKLYTGSVAGSSGLTGLVGAGSGMFRYNSDATMDNFSAALTPGVSAVYREQPTLTVGSNSASIIYGDALPGFAATYSGLQNGDTTGQALSSAATATAGGALSTSGHTNAGAHAVTAAGAVDQLGYSVVHVNGSLTVAQKVIASTGSTAADKTYDGTNAATVDTSATTFGTGAANSGDGLAYSGDVVSVNNAAVTTGVFADKNAAVGKTVAINGIALQGADAGNYSITGSATATIAQKVLTATATAADKAYDGTTTAAPALTLSGLVGTETLGVSGTGAFNSKDVVSATTVTVNSVALADGSNGGLASNYTLGTGQTTAANITPKELLLSVVAPDKVYDGNDSSAVTVNIDAGLVGGETLAITGTGVFNSKNVVAASYVTLDSAMLANGTGLASNYSVAASVGGLTDGALITPKVLTVTASTANKVYDGNNLAAATLDITSGLVGTETLTATANATFNSKDVLTANTVTVNAATLADGANGGLASNYSVAAGQTVAANITPKDLTLSVVAADKVYDGSDISPVTVNIDAGLVGSEALGVTGTGVFNSKNVITATHVTLDSATLSDGTGLASNYSVAASLATFLTDGALITPQTLTASATAPNKVYDGNTGATAVLSITSGLVGTETVTASGSGTFNSKDVITANMVTVGAASLADGANGGLASNYALAGGQTAAANITPKALTIAASGVNKVYDGLADATVNLSDDRIAGDVLSASVGAASYGDKNVGNAKTVSVSGVSLSGADADNYTYNTTAATSADITAKALTISATGVNKVYDGLTGATVNLSDDRVAGDVLSTSLGAASYGDKNVGNAKAVSVSGVSLSGADAGNYTYNTMAATSADITAKALTISATGVNKVYDGLTGATVNLADDRVAGDVLSASVGAASYGDKNVGNAKAVSVSGVSLSGADAGNYTFNTTAATSADITAKALTIAASGVNKVYDGSTGATVTLSDDRVAGDMLSTSVGAASYGDKNVGIAKAVDVSGVSLNGADAGNYTYNTTAATTADVTAKALTIAASGVNKVYDGLTGATVNLSDDRVAGDVLSTSLGAASYGDKNVGIAKAINVGGVSLSGADAGNYTYNITAATTADVTAKALTIAASGVNKVYDGLTGATVNLSDDRVAGDVLSASVGTASYADKNVGNAKAVTVSGVSLSGVDAGNYTYNTTTATTADITARALTISATGVNKVYDGLTGATVNLADNRVVGDVLSASVGAASYGDKNVGNAKAVSVSGVSLSGVDAGNYTYNTTAATSANITAKALTISASGVNKVYNGLTGATVNLSDNRVAGDVLSTSVGAASYGDKNVGSAKAVTVSGVSLSGVDAGNYTYNTTAATTANITAKALTISASGVNKVYDGSTAATVNLSDNRVAGDVLSTSGAASFNDKNVGNAKAVSVSGVSLSGVDAGNYTYNTAAATTANITAKALTASVTAPNKVYDGNSNAAHVLSIDSGLVSGEKLAVTSSASFNTKDVATANMVTVNSVALVDGAGGSASNYSLASGQTAIAHITPKALTASAAAPNKVYDGNTTGAPALTITSGLVGAEIVTASGSGTFNTKDVLTANLVTVNGVTLANGPVTNGGLASNYSLANGQTAIAHITPKALTASAANAVKVYDGTRNAATAMNITAGLVGAETLVSTGAGVYNSKDVSTANQVTVNAVALANGANGGLASNYSLVAGQVGTGSITALPSVTWLGTSSANWSDASNWQGGAIPDLNNVLNVVIPAGKSVTFNSNVPALNGSVQLAGIGGAGTLAVGGGTLALSDTLSVGSYAQSAGQVNTGAFKVTNGFNQSGGKLAITAAGEISQAAGVMTLGDISAGSLTVGGGGSIVQLTGSALAAGGASSISAPGQAITLANAGNDFSGDLSLLGGVVQVADKNALSLGTSTVGSLQVTAKGDVTQKGALTVAGNTVIDTTGAITLVNAGNDFVGLLGGTGGVVKIKDKNLLTISKLTGTDVELGAGTELQVTPGGMVDAPNIGLALSPTAVKGAIGSPTNLFQVRTAAHVTLGATSPAVPTYIGGDGAQVSVGNLSAAISYIDEAWYRDSQSTIAAQIAQILLATQKKADSNVELIERGLGSDLSVPIPYPHEGAVRTRSPECERTDVRCD